VVLHDIGGEDVNKDNITIKSLGVDSHEHHHHHHQ
jgi:hypothetical protein